MAPVDYLRTLARRWQVVAGFVLIGALLGSLTGSADSATDGTNAAAVTMIPTRPDEGSIAPQPDAAAVNRDLALAARLATGAQVAKIAAANLQPATTPRTLAGSVDASADPGAGTLTVTAHADDPGLAAERADALAAATISELGRLGLIELRVLDRMSTPAGEDHLLPRTAQARTSLGAGLGACLGVLVALLVRRRRHARVRTDAQAAEAFELPVLAQVPRHRRARPAGPVLAVRSQPNGPVAEAYRRLRSAVLSPPGPDDEHIRQVIAVASARRGDGKSSTVGNLAAALAEAGRSVLVIDADFAHPGVHDYLQTTSGVGLCDVLGSHLTSDLRAAIRATAVPGVTALTVGGGGRHPGAVLIGMATVLAEARERADFVLLDGAGLLEAADAADALREVDGIVLACRYGRDDLARARRTRALAERACAPVLGVVLLATPLGPDIRWASAPSYTAASARPAHRTRIPPEPPRAWSRVTGGAARDRLSTGLEPYRVRAAEPARPERPPRQDGQSAGGV